MKRVPRSFTFGPLTINVRLISKVEMGDLCPEDEEPPLGLWRRDEGVIYLQRARKGFPKDSQIQTFWHEFFHALFETLGYDKLSDNEKLVDQCGLLMLQAQRTFQY